jgi:hypothetical protein
MKKNKNKILFSLKLDFKICYSYNLTLKKAFKTRAFRVVDAVG